MNILGVGDIFVAKRFPDGASFATKPLSWQSGSRSQLSGDPLYPYWGTLSEYFPPHHNYRRSFGHYGY